MKKWRDYAATGKPGTCIWCGEELRRPVEATNTMERLPGPEGGIRFHRIPKAARKPRYSKPGDYGDGHFCGLRCGYMFGVEIADQGTRMRPVKRT
jgi:hypothetical protein